MCQRLSRLFWHRIPRDAEISCVSQVHRARRVLPPDTFSCDSRNAHRTTQSMLVRFDSKAPPSRQRRTRIAGGKPAALAPSAQGQMKVRRAVLAQVVETGVVAGTWGMRETMGSCDAASRGLHVSHSPRQVSLISRALLEIALLAGSTSLGVASCWVLICKYSFFPACWQEYLKGGTSGETEAQILMLTSNAWSTLS